MSRVALVTGGNKGLGYSIVKGLAKSKFNNQSIVVLLGSRDLQRGEAAKKKLSEEDSIQNVQVIQLDITNQHSIETAASKIKDDFGGLDILVHNAGMAYKGDQFDEQVCRNTIDTNYYGTLHTHQALAPLLRENSRVVFVSSSSGRKAFQDMSNQKRESFFDEKINIEKLSRLLEEFITDVRNNDFKEKGWPSSAYGMSKAGVTTLTRIFARDSKVKGIAFNAMCPGLTQTDMTGHKGHSPDEGARTAIKCALLPISDKPQTGLFWRDNEPQPFY